VPAGSGGRAYVHSERRRIGEETGKTMLVREGRPIVNVSAGEDIANGGKMIAYHEKEKQALKRTIAKVPSKATKKGGFV